MISPNLKAIKEEINENTTLVVVSKYRTNNDILEVYNHGHLHFGENRVQELMEKQKQLPNNILWHQIGHLQSNKVKYIIPFVYLIHAVDSITLLETINKEAIKQQKTINCLLQIHIASESSKHGFTYPEIHHFMTNELYLNYKNVNIIGLMGMATYTNNVEQIKQEFSDLKACYDLYKNYKTLSFKYLSMGMSQDYQIALACGSNMLRIGSKIFEN